MGRQIQMYLWALVMSRKPFTFVFHRVEIIERFLGIGTPNSTCSKDLEEFVLKMFESNKIDKGHWLDYDFWSLMPLSAIFQLYHGDQF